MYFYLCFKIICACGLAVCLFCGCGKQNGIQKFQDAQNVFDTAQNTVENISPEERSQRFLQAAVLYEDLIQQGIKSGTIYYNLGNAYANAHEPVKALAAYHLARRYRPLDSHVVANIQTVLNGSEPTTPEIPLVERLLFWQNSMGVQTKARCSLFFTTLTFVCAAIWLFFPKRQIKYLTLTGLAISILSVLSVGYDWYRFEKTQYAVVAVEQAFPRKGNSENYENAFTSAVPFGSTAVVFYERNHWIFLHFGTDRNGWLPKEQVVIF